MATRLTQASFTRGELSPRLDARTQLEQYSLGLKTAKNAIIHQEGGISNRMGLEFCGEVKDSTKTTRLMKFVFNSEQTYMLEFGHKYIRFLHNGGYIVDENANIVEVETPYEDKDLMKISRSQSGDYLTLTHPKYSPKNLIRNSHTSWTLSDIIFKSQIEAPTGVSATWTGSTSSNVVTYKYLVTAVKSDTNEESARSSIVSAKGHREASWLAGEYMTIKWSAVTGASEYNVYRNVNGIYGYLGTAQGTTFVDDNIEPDLTSSAPIAKNPFNGAQNYPSCSCYYQQRMVYANSINKPQTMWSSQTGATNNFNISRPLIATDAVTITMDDREMNEIRHLIPMKDLIVLTSNSEWRVNGTNGIFEANPAPAATIQSCYGASYVEPVISGNQVIFVQSGGSVIRDLGYDYMSEGYDGDELSLFSNHLFEGKEVVSMAYAKEPYRLLWVVFNDGSCASLTYNKKQKLCGWTRIVTDGFFESVEVVREGLEDVAYFVIKREINGQTKRYIERTKSRIINNAKTGFLVDSGLSATFETPVRTISGLEHLENKTVICNVNGGVIANLKVQNGHINFAKDVYSIVVGLPYEFEIETLNVEGENTQGLKKLINHISVKVYNSREDFKFCGANNFEFRHARSDSSINNSGKLFSKDISSTVFALPMTNATVKLKQDYPLPLTILSLSANIEVQDNEGN